jgi:CheY-like chemotaxis protein/signal transduction histidine kinase
LFEKRVEVFMSKRYVKLLLFVAPITVVMFYFLWVTLGVFYEYKNVKRLQHQVEDLDELVNLYRYYKSELVCLTKFHKSNPKIVERQCKREKGAIENALVSESVLLQTPIVSIKESRDSIKQNQKRALQALANGGLEGLYKKNYSQVTEELRGFSYQNSASEMYDALTAYFQQKSQKLAFDLFSHVYMAYGIPLDRDAKNYFITRYTGEANVALATLTPQKLQQLYMTTKPKIEQERLGELKQDITYVLIKREQSYFWKATWSLLLFLGSLWTLYKLLRLYVSNREGEIFYKRLFKKSQETFSLEEGVLDETQRKQSNYALIEENLHTLYYKERRLDVANREKHRLLAEIANDIRMPLNGMKTHLSLCTTTKLDETQRGYVKSIGKNIDLLHKVVDSTLIGVSDDVESMEIELINFDLHQQVELVVDGFMIGFEQREVDFSLFIDPKLYYIVQGDMAKLTTLLHILLSYASHFCKEHGLIMLLVNATEGRLDRATFTICYTDKEALQREKEIAVLLSQEAHQAVAVEDVSDPSTFDIVLANRIVTLLGGKLEHTVHNEDAYFTFSLMLPKIEQHQKVYPQFEQLKVGIALPFKEMEDEVEHYLEEYLTHLGIVYEYYYYEALFSETPPLPDILIVHTRYAQQEELEKLVMLQSHIAIVTSYSRKERLQQMYRNCTISDAPMTMHKVIKMVKESLYLLEHEEEEIPQSFATMRALVVEDNPIARKILVEVLGHLGLEVSVANNGRVAFDLCRGHHFDIIFMDIDMPIMNGVESTQKILYYEHVNQLEHTPLIAVTAYNESEQKEYFVGLGMDEVISKPIYSEKIKEVIQHYCIDRKKEG